MTEDFDYVAALDDVTIKTDDGRVRVCLGLRFTVMLGRPWTLETRLALADCIDLYARTTGSQLVKHWMKIGNWNWSAKEQTARDFVAQRSTDKKDMACYLSGGKELRQAYHYGLTMFADSQYVPEDDLAYLSVSVPLSWATAQPPGAFAGLARELCALTAPVHAYGGFAIILPIDTSEERRFAHLAYPLLMRFPGLDDGNQSAVRIARDARHLRGANWLLGINREIAARLGGKDALGARLGNGFSIYDTPSGILVQAGRAPQLGDLNRRLMPQHYCRLGAVIAPVRGTIKRWLRVPPEVDAETANEAWQARFDACGEE